MKTSRAILITLALLTASACIMVPSSESAPPSMMPTMTPTASAAPTAATSTGLTPNAAADLLRKSVVGTRPLLIPNTVPDTWRADITLEGTTAFRATYRDQIGAKTFTYSIAAANPPLPTANTVQSHPQFHGDASSLYQIADGTNVTSDRFLLWTETGVWPGWPKSGIPYYVSSTGIDETEFWQLTNGLHPDQIGG